MIGQVPIQLAVSAASERADLYITGDITKAFSFFGFDIGQDSDTSYDDVVSALDGLPDAVTEIFVHINSYGGMVSEGVAIYNALRSHKARVTTVCEGFACSIASVVFMAGQRRVMRPASLLMLHNASMPAQGNAHDLRKAADDLDVITGLSKTAYLSRATEALTPGLLDEVMDAETWVTPAQALEWGLATETDEPDCPDAPTQGARALVMERLTKEPPARAVAQVSLTAEQMDEIKADVLGRLLMAGGASARQPAGAARGEKAAPKAEGAAARLSRIFAQISKGPQQ